MAGGQTSGAVTDWQTVAEPNDWQTVTETANPLTANPKSEGLYSVKKGNQTIKVPFSQIQSAATQGYELTPEDSERYAKDASYAAKGAPSGVARFLSSAKEPLVGAVKGLYHTVTDAPQSRQEKFANLLGPGALLLDRSIAEPAVEQGKQAVQSAKEAYHAPNAPSRHAAASEAVGHGLAAVTPVFGPWAANVGETEGTELGEKNYAGAAGTAVGNALLALAPKAVEGGARAILRNAPDAVRAVTGTGKRSVGELVGKTREANAKATEAAKDANAAQDASHLEKTQAAVEKQHGARTEAIRKGRAAESAHQAETADVKEANRRALEEQKSRQAAEQKLKTSSEELRARIETAREKALKEGNEKYNAVNEKLNPLSADMEQVEGGWQDAMLKIKGTEAEPTVLKSIGKRIEEGVPFTYNDLQGYYSELNAELSKGTLPGDIYTAYDTMHEAIGEEMQRIADSQGVGSQLTNARNYWRRMKQTFGKPFNPGDVANQTMKGVTPDFVKSEEMANRMRLLGSFDPEIPKAAQGIENAQRGLDALPKEKPLREILKQNPEKPTPTRIPPLQEAPAPVRPEPVTPETKTIDPEDIQKAKRESLQKRADQIRHYANRAALYVTTYRALAAVGRAAIGDPAALAAVPADIGEGIAVAGGGNMVASLLEKPRIVEMLTKATPADVEAIPPELRGGLGDIVDAARKRGIRVSPALLKVARRGTVAAALGGRKYTHTATNPQGHRIGSHDGQTWYDAQTGQQVQ